MFKSNEKKISSTTNFISETKYFKNDGDIGNIVGDELLSATFCNNDIKPQDDFQHHNSITKILF
jgi:hypothetical protein